MAKKSMGAREKAREKLLIGIFLLILPTGLRVLNLNLGTLGLFVDALSLVGLILMIIGIVGLVKNPKMSA